MHKIFQNILFYIEVCVKIDKLSSCSKLETLLLIIVLNYKLYCYFVALDFQINGQKCCKILKQNYIQNFRLINTVFRKLIIKCEKMSKTKKNYTMKKIYSFIPFTTMYVF